MSGPITKNNLRGSAIAVSVAATILVIGFKLKALS